jgi:hypothetical protein
MVFKWDYLFILDLKSNNNKSLYSFSWCGYLQMNTKSILTIVALAAALAMFTSPMLGLTSALAHDDDDDNGNSCEQEISQKQSNEQNSQVVSGDDTDNSGNNFSFQNQDNDGNNVCAQQ